MENIYTSDYYKLIMLDLPEILEEKVINVNNFFKNEANESHEEDDDERDEDKKEAQLGQLTVELGIDNDKAEPFSHEPCTYLKLSTFNDIHNIEEEIIKEINDK